MGGVFVISERLSVETGDSVPYAYAIAEGLSFRDFALGNLHPVWIVNTQTPS
jgi:hypothetical protein